MLSHYHTPGFLEGVNLDIGAYLSGFADGEGCFCVSVNRSRRHRFGWEIRPSFSVSQNRARANALQIFKQHLGCGTIRPDSSDETLKFEVRSIDDLTAKVLHHFERYPLLSEKKADFEKFADICRMMKAKKHLTKEGLHSILKLAGEVNRSGKKKFLRQEIKI